MSPAAAARTSVSRASRYKLAMMPKKGQRAPRRENGAENSGPEFARMSELLTLWRRSENDQVAAEAIYSTLREAFLSGLLAPGDRLGEMQLAKLFNRSRTPVREAIFRLESERLTERSARRGFVVGGITREQVLEVYAVRGALDGLAARLAAQGILPAELDHLKWLNSRMRVASGQEDFDLMLNLNIKFHEAICRSSRNSVVLQFMGQIHDWVRRFPQSTFSFKGRAPVALTEHDELIEAIANRQPEEAERIARAHMENALQVRVAMLQARHDTP
jgi:DNA-binding GntR family transcriptional regulator